MSKDEDTIPVDEAVRQIGIMAERVAMLHYHYANTLVQELGEERGRAMAARAIAAYGQEVGERQRQRVVAAGFSADCQNYGLLPDLPLLAWSRDRMPVVERGGKEIHVCPLALYWIEKGQESLGRLYCFVDQAKYAAFDPDCEARHLKNVLDGDECCEVVARKRGDWQAGRD
jgi:hypothetical protein